MRGRRAESLLLLGGTSEIGLAIARELIAEGTTRVILAGRHAEDLGRTARDLRRANVSVEVENFDADAAETHPAFVRRILDVHGDIDIAVVAFGILHGTERTTRDHDAAVAMFRTNALGTISIALALAAEFSRRRNGTIVVMSSIAAIRPRKANFVYGASKAALDAFGQGMNDFLHGTGVRVVIVRPGFVRTKMTAGMRSATMSVSPDLVGRLVARAIATEAEVVWVPTRLRLVAVMVQMIPRFVWRRMSR